MDQEQPAKERQRVGRRGPRLYTPAVTANWRLRLLRKGNVSDAELGIIK